MTRPSQTMLAPLLAVLAMLLALTGSASAAFDDTATEPHYGNFLVWESEVLEESPPEPLEFSRERIDYSYDLASGVPVYVRQNPWSAFDPLGLYGALPPQAAKAYKKHVQGPDADKYLKPTAMMAGSFVPGVGEAQDGLVLADPNAKGWEKLLAGGSLSLNGLTAGLLPNIGGFLRAGKEVVEQGAKHADEVVDSARRIADEGAEAVSKNVDEVSPTNYPNPDPPMDAPAVKYDPQSSEELMRMRNGKGPTTKKTHGNQNIEAHHRQQVPTSKGGKIDEATQQQHRGKGKHSRHDKPSRLTPSQRKKEIKEHYKERSKEYVADGEGI